MDLLPNISEPVLRLSAFVGILAAMAFLELVLPKRRLKYSKSHRWFTNFAIAGLDTLLVRLMAQLTVPIAAVSTALYAEAKGWGLLNMLDLPFALEAVLVVAVLDFAIYLQHVASHKIPLLWRIHAMHHSDVDFDVTTAIRFHPIEIALSMLYKCLLVLILGPAAGAVVIFEIILNGSAMFNHANLNLPPWLDRVLRTFLVTPDMHRVHHSTERHETDSNYGFALSFWDRMFATYKDQPELGHRDMQIGLPNYQSESPTGLSWSLALPFQKRRSGEPDS